jgi:ubiquinone/menaquinone biosynthesis C-methylase UbiE
MVEGVIGRCPRRPDGVNLAPMPSRLDLPVDPGRPVTGTLGPAAARAVAAYDAAADRRDDPALGFLVRAADRTIAALDLQPGMRVLDLACGTGVASLLAAQAVAPRGRVLGVDLSESMLEVARAKARRADLGDVLEFRHGDMIATGLPDDSFDAVVCVFGLVLVADMEGLVRELWRMVKPGGRLVITTWGPRLWAPMMDVWKAAIAAERPDLIQASDPWDRVTDPTAMAELLRAAGIAEGSWSVLPEFERWPLRTPRDWWSIVMGSGLRWAVDQLEPDAADRVRRASLEHARHHGVDWITTNVLYATATKPLD